MFSLPHNIQYLPIFIYFLWKFLTGDLIHIADPLHSCLYSVLF